MAGQRGGKHASAAADIQHFTFGVRRQRRQQQLATDIQSVAAEYARQRFDGQPVDIVLGPPGFKTKLRLLFQTTMVKAATSRAIYFVQRRIVRQHRFGATYAAAVFPHDENIDAHRHQRQNIHQLELRFGFIFRPVVDQRIAVSDIAGLRDQAKTDVFAHLAA
ncbi:Uncharacterised protein [Salmonella enterica subsp. enterica serovar Bovismorbificans]|nr:Uncharacterised protein [Salmonella enterica subsp. enterica serovar Bovismorbificans]